MGMVIIKTSRNNQSVVNQLILLPTLQEILKLILVCIILFLAKTFFYFEHILLNGFCNTDAFLNEAKIELLN